MHKFFSDCLFDDFDLMYCFELPNGGEFFTSWSEFLELFNEYSEHVRVKPKYVNAAFLAESLGLDITNENIPEIIIDATQYIEVPWFELDPYIFR